MFENLSQRFQDIIKKLTGKGKLSVEDVDAALKEVRIALLAADVHLSAVKAFSQNVREKAVAREILESLTPGQQVVKVVRDELTEMLGPGTGGITVSSYPNSLMLIGLQGSGKTTTCAKLARIFKKKDKSVLLVGLDLKRPAALDQLKYLAKQEGIPCFAEQGASPQSTTQKAQEYFRAHHFDLAILDTAGRLHTDQDLMAEVKDVQDTFRPTESILVLDATTGHVALSVAEEFKRWLDYDSIILTKMDGDARGGAALSCRYVTAKPIRYVGIGEKTEDLEPFYAERLASRILGMGDVLTLIEKAEEAFSLKQQEKVEQALLKEKINLSDFLEQMRGLGKMGDISGLLPSIPGLPQLAGAKLDENMLKRWEAIILSMTLEERLYPEIINSSRKKRVSGGSGTSVQEVNILLKRFEQFKLMSKQVKKGVLPKFMRNIN